jgi:polygalacturonase
MNHQQKTAGNGLGRRQFLRNSVLLTVPLMAGGAMAGTLMRTGGTLGATQLVYDPPARDRGTTLVDVKSFGAQGDGIFDDTNAIQAAINSLPSTGGTVFVPAGTYLIDAVKSINLRSLMHFQMDPEAVLVVKTNTSDRYLAILADVIHDVEISGGRIIGDRDTHVGTTGEGGHGIKIRGASRVTIRDIHISKGWGDGISVGPKPQYQKHFINSQDVVVANVVCTENRRNGLAITNVIGMKVFDSEFSNTKGTSPQCGIDVEPNQDYDMTGYNDQVWIENCVMKGNAAYGVNVWKRSRNLTITKCTISDNLSCGIVTTGLNAGTFTDNTFCNNMKTGLYIKDGTHDLTISGNTSYNNYLKQGLKIRTPFYLTGVSTKVQKDLIVGTGTYSINVGSNYYK